MSIAVIVALVLSATTFASVVAPRSAQAQAGITNTCPAGDVSVALYGGSVTNGISGPAPSVDTFPGHCVQVISTADWAIMTVAEFEQWDVIWIGNDDCGGLPSSGFATATATVATWEQAIDPGKVMIAGGDFDYHVDAGQANAITVTTAMLATLSSGSGPGLVLQAGCYAAYSDPWFQNIGGSFTGLTHRVSPGGNGDPTNAEVNFAHDFNASNGFTATSYDFNSACHGGVAIAPGSPVEAYNLQTIFSFGGGPCFIMSEPSAPPVFPDLVLDKLPPTGTLAVGETLTYTFDVSNPGSALLVAIAVSDPLTAPVSCPSTTLAAGASMTCSATYVVTQADVDAGEVSNTATATGESELGLPYTDEDTEVVSIPAAPAIDLVKNAPTGTLEAGSTITYGFDVENTGNVTLDPVSVDDPTANPVTCVATVLAPDATTTCSASYLVTQADVDAGEILNTATATGVDPNGTSVTATDDQTTLITADPAISVVKSADVSEVNAVGDPVNYSFVVTNDGNVTLDPVSVFDPMVGSVTCAVTRLGPGDSTTCTADAAYAATQADMDAGFIENTATASGIAPDGVLTRADGSETVDAISDPAISVTKSADVSEVTAAGDLVNYSFVVTNDGNVTLDPVSVSDPMVGSVTCAVTVLAPGASTTCDADAAYAATQADVDAGEIVNVATASGTAPDGGSTSGTATETVDAVEDAAISVVKSADVSEVASAGDLVNFSFVVTNDGNVTLDPVSVSDPMVGSVTCAVTVLAPGASTTCDADAAYAATQADIDAGEIVNVATASGTAPDGGSTSGTATETVDAVEDAAISVVKSADVSEVTEAGDLVNYSFVVINDGNVTLDPVSVSDPMVGSVTCAVTALAPGASTTCDADAAYVVTQADMDAGVIENTATATGVTPDGGSTSADGSETVDALPDPAISVTKSADVTEVTAAGDLINYSFTVTNDGNVTLDPVSVSDPMVGSVTCVATSLAPAASTTCDADAAYVVTQADVDAGEIVNLATASGTTPDGGSTTGSATETVDAPEDPAISVTKSADVTEVTAAGQLINYSFVVTNDGNVTLDPVSVSDPMVGSVTCALTSLAPAASTTCAADAPYVVTQADVDAGEIVNLATASGATPDGGSTTATATETVDAPEDPAISVTKSADVSEVAAAGDLINFSFVVTNDGNVTLDPVSVSDPMVGSVTCALTSPAPGASTTCTADVAYVVTQADIDAGVIENTATASGTTPDGGSTTATATETVDAPEDPAISVTKSADVTEVTAAGDLINFSFVVTNDGNVTLDPVSVSDPMVGSVTCVLTSLAPSASTSCDADAAYVVTQADVDAGEIVNLATASGTAPDGGSTTGTATETVDAPGDPAISVTKSADVSEVAAAGDLINFSFIVTNDGNVTLDPVSVSDPMVGSVTCVLTSLAPGASTSCAADAAYVVTQADMDAGLIENTATASGTTPDGGSTSADGSETVDALPEPAVSVTKAADVAEVTAAGDLINFSFVVTNDGNVTLDPVSVSDPMVGSVTCVLTSLTPGGSTICSADAAYVVTQADIDAGEIVNLATASGTTPDGGSTTATATETVDAIADPSVGLVKSSSTTELTFAGQIVPFTFEVTNTGNVTLTGLTVTDPLIPVVTCPIDVLAPGESTTCTGDYVVTQADVDAGQFENTATATANPPAGDPVSGDDTVTTPAEINGSLDFVKSADVAEVTVAGGEIVFSFEVTNTGNVTVNSIAVSDPLVGWVTCALTSLAPGASTTCTADAAYVVTQDDIDSGAITNTATVSGTPPVGDPVDDTDTVTVDAPADPSLELVKSSTTTELTFAGQIVPFTFEVTNTGNVTLDEVVIDDPLIADVSCPLTPLAPGATVTCTGDYIVTQDDVDAGFFENTATGSATPPFGDPVEDTDTVVTPSTQLPGIDVDKFSDVSDVTNAGDPVVFSFIVTNTGNVTMDNITVSDPLVGAVTCPTAVLLPGDSMTCSAAPYAVTQLQIDAGGFINNAAVSGDDPFDTPHFDGDSIGIDASSDPAIVIVKSSDTEDLTEAGQIVPFTFTVSNTGNVTISNIAVDDPLTGPVTCPGVDLAPGESATCTADYIVTQDDVDVGQFENTATATGTAPDGSEASASDSVVTPSTPRAEVSVDKLDPTGLLQVGETLSYQFIVRNEGNVTLTDVAVDDPTAGPVVCADTTLLPGQTTICSADYVVTQADVDAGEIVNTAAVTATPPTGDDVVDEDTVTSTIEQEPSLTLDKASTTTDITTAGQVIPFTFEVTNTGNVTLSGLVVDDPLTGPISCPTSELAPGEATICTVDYFATQADVDAGVFSNTAVATMTGPDGTPTNGSDTVVTPSPQGPGVMLDKQAPDGELVLGATLRYDLVVTNVGNVTLTALSVTDPTAGPVTCPTASLLPGASMTCVAEYVVTQADIDSGKIINAATVSATPPDGIPITEEDVVETPIEQSPSLNLIKRTEDSLDAVGQTLSYTFDITNTGNVTITDIAIADPLIAAVDCPASTLLPAETITCTGSYLVTQADIDAGNVVNTATASGVDPNDEPTSDTDTETSFGQQAPSVEIDKLTPVGTLSAGETITYFFEVANTGNVTLTDVAVSDPIAGDVTCNTTVLAPGDTTLCEAVYPVTQADVDAGQIVNNATVSATPPEGEPVTEEDTETTLIPADPSVEIDKLAPTGELAVGQTITYTFVVTNTGNVTLSGIAVSDPLIDLVSCDTTTVAPASQASCTGSYVVTQADVDAGQVVNEASVTATPPIGEPVDGTDTVTTPIDQNPSVSLDKIAPVQTPVLGATLTYTFAVLNTGDVTVTNVSVSDPLTGSVDCDVTVLAPAETATCSGTYVVTQTDVDAGEILNQATVSATDPTGSTVEGDDEVDLDVDQSGELWLIKDSSAGDLVLDEVINFTFEVTNAGNVTMSDIVVDDPMVGTVDCPVTTLAPSESTTCNGSYTVTQSDVDAGAITNTATATGTQPNGETVDASDTELIEGTPRPSIDVDKYSDDGPFVLGDVIEYEFTVTNSGNLTLTEIAITDDLVEALSCPVIELAPAETMVCTANYAVTQVDIDAGQIINVATVSAVDPDGEPRDDVDTEVTPMEQVEGILIDKLAPVGTLAAGETVTYNFDVANTGTVTLSNVSIADPLIADVTCGETTLAPATSTTCSGSYEVTQADVDAGEIINSATVLGDTPSGSVGGEDTETTVVAQDAQLTLVKRGPSVELALGDSAQYFFDVANTGNVTVDEIVVDDPLTGGAVCPATTLAPGQAMTCSANYTVTQADVDAGFIVNSATVGGTSPNGSNPSSISEITTPVTQRPAINLDKDAPTGELVAGADIAYSFTITNVGTVTLTGISVDDPLIEPVACSVDTLAPGESTTCTATYAVTQNDVDRGEVINVASVNATTPSGEAIADADSETTEFEPAADLTLVKTAPDGPFEVGQELEWTFTVANNGNVTLSNIDIDDPLTGSVACPDETLAPGQSMTCAGTSTISQADVDAGTIVNAAIASATDPFGTTLTTEDSVTLEIPAAPAVDVLKTSVIAAATLGDEVPFTIQVTNIGNVTLHDLEVVDIYAPVTCPEQALAVGESMTCTSIMTVTQAMVAAGGITNVATVAGLTPGGSAVDGVGTEQLTVTRIQSLARASIKLTKLPPTETLRAGDTVTYSFEVENDGDVLLGGITIDDPLTSDVTCPLQGLAPGASMTCTARYVVTAADQAAGTVTNSATATGFGPNGERPSDDDTIVSAVEQPAPTPTPTAEPTPTATPTAEPTPTATPSPTPTPSPTAVAPRAVFQPAPLLPRALDFDPTPPVAEPTPGPAEEPAGPLAFTGTQTTGGVAIAFTLLTAGGALVIWNRRRGGDDENW